MNKITLSLLFTILFMNFACKATNNEILYSKKMVDSQMKRSGIIQNWDYPNGLFVESILKVYDKYNDEAYYNYALQHAQATIDKDGKIGKKYKFSDYNIDYVCPGMFLIRIYENEKNNDNRYKVALDTLRKQLAHQPRNSENGFWHKKIYPNQMWLDGIFMGSRYYAKYDVMFNNGENLDDVIHQFSLIHSKTYDKDKQLNYHAWAEDPNQADAFWAKKEDPFKGCSHEFWARGNGWFFAALVDVLEVIPNTHPRHSEMLNILEDVAVGIKRYQDKESGLWYQLLEYDNSTCAEGKCNYLEGSASSMFTYAMLKAVRLGFLSKEEYGEAGKKAYEGLIKYLISEDAEGNISLNNVCRSAGLGPAKSPDRDGSIKYYLAGSDAGDVVSNDLKGVGPFIMASLEYEIMKEAETTDIHEAKKEDNSLSFNYSKNEYSINIFNKNEKPALINIYNSFGKKMDSIQTKTDQLSFSVSNYPKGIYLIHANQLPCEKIMVF